MCVIMEKTKLESINASWHSIENVYDQYYDENYPQKEQVRNYRELLWGMNNLDPFQEFDYVIDVITSGKNSKVNEQDLLKEYSFEWTSRYIKTAMILADFCSVWLEDIHEELDAQKDTPDNPISLKRMVSILEYAFQSKVGSIISDMKNILSETRYFKCDSDCSFSDYQVLKCQHIKEMIKEARENLKATEESILEKTMACVQKVLDGEEYRKFVYAETDEYGNVVAYYSDPDDIESSPITFSDEEVRGMINWSNHEQIYRMTTGIMDKHIREGGWKYGDAHVDDQNWIWNYDFTFDPDYICGNEKEMLEEIKDLVVMNGGEWIEEKNHVKFVVDIDKIETLYCVADEEEEEMNLAPEPKHVDLEGELFNMIVQSKGISEGVFHNKDVLRMFCHNFILDYRQKNSYDSAELVVSAFSSHLQKFEEHLSNAEHKSNPTLRKAVVLSEMSYMKTLPKELYISIAAYNPELLEKCDLLWCEKHANRFRPVRNKLEMTMTPSNARDELMRQMSQYAKEKVVA